MNLLYICASVLFLHFPLNQRGYNWWQKGYFMEKKIMIAVLLQKDSMSCMLKEQKETSYYMSPFSVE